MWTKAALSVFFILWALTMFFNWIFGLDFVRGPALGCVILIEFLIIFKLSVSAANFAEGKVKR